MTRWPARRVVRPCRSSPAPYPFRAAAPPAGVPHPVPFAGPGARRWPGPGFATVLHRGHAGWSAAPWTSCAGG